MGGCDGGCGGGPRFVFRFASVTLICDLESGDATVEEPDDEELLVFSCICCCFCLFSVKVLLSSVLKSMGPLFEAELIFVAVLFCGGLKLRWPAVELELLAGAVQKKEMLIKKFSLLLL